VALQTTRSSATESLPERVVGNPYLGITSGLPVTRGEPLRIQYPDRKNARVR